MSSHTVTSRLRHDLKAAYCGVCGGPLEEESIKMLYHDPNEYDSKGIPDDGDPGKYNRKVLKGISHLTQCRILQQVHNGGVKDSKTNLKVPHNRDHPLAKGIRCDSLMPIPNVRISLHAEVWFKDPSGSDILKSGIWWDDSCGYYHDWGTYGLYRVHDEACFTVPVHSNCMQILAYYARVKARDFDRYSSLQVAEEHLGRCVEAMRHRAETMPEDPRSIGGIYWEVEGVTGKTGTKQFWNTPDQHAIGNRWIVKRGFEYLVANPNPSQIYDPDKLLEAITKWVCDVVRSETSSLLQKQKEADREVEDSDQHIEYSSLEKLPLIPMEGIFSNLYKEDIESLRPTSHMICTTVENVLCSQRLWMNRFLDSKELLVPWLWDIDTEKVREWHEQHIKGNGIGIMNWREAIKAIMTRSGSASEEGMPWGLRNRLRIWKIADHISKYYYENVRKE